MRRIPVPMGTQNRVKKTAAMSAPSVRKSPPRSSGGGNAAPPNMSMMRPGKRRIAKAERASGFPARPPQSKAGKYGSNPQEMQSKTGKYGKNPQKNMLTPKRYKPAREQMQNNLQNLARPYGMMSKIPRPPLKSPSGSSGGPAPGKSYRRAGVSANMNQAMAAPPNRKRVPARTQSGGAFMMRRQTFQK